jgi:S1-C subfamily serine protease
MKLVASLYIGVLLFLTSCATAPHYVPPLAEWQYSTTVRVMVVCPDGSGGIGTGVAIGPNRVLTANHVVNACEGIRIAVIGYDTEIREALLGTFDASADAATLSTGGTPFEHYAKVSRLPLKLDDRVCSVGGDNAVMFMKKCGNVFLLELEGHVVYSTIPTVRGNSGGPLFRGNELVGIIVAARTDPNFERVSRASGVPAWAHLVEN